MENNRVESQNGPKKWNRRIIENNSVDTQTGPKRWNNRIMENNRVDTQTGPKRWNNRIMENNSVDTQSGPNRWNNRIMENKSAETENAPKKWNSKRELRRQRKAQSQKHRARLVVHNLPFAATEDDVKKHFSQFGEIEEVVLLKKEPGVLTGCGFVQYKLVQKAAKAKHHLNGKPFMGREITCDFTRPKDRYDKVKELAEYDPNKPIKEEPSDFDESIVKEEQGSDEDVELKEEVKSEEETEGHEEVSMVEEEQAQSVNVEEEEDTAAGSDEEEEEEQEPEASSDDEDVEDEEAEVEEVETEKKKVSSNDASEGKTIFIKNCPFTAENEDLQECMSQFGPLHYALVCIDPLTEHSKGTAFVKFKNKEDADKCLASTDTLLMSHTLQCVRALTRDELQKSRAKDTQGKDSRNLYLAKEGLILAGTTAADGVSSADMTKRLQVEQYKNQMLKNLNMFLSRTRLVVHNIPANWDDAKLRSLFKKHVSPKAHIMEARIMRNMRQIDGKGVGKSKEFGFVTFKMHEDALEALRALNNNPNIFSPAKRPIVAFSIENRTKLNAKQRQIENSKFKNPTFKHNTLEKNKKSNSEQMKGKKRKIEEKGEPEGKEFAGVMAKPGVKKMRTKFNLKTQAQLHRERLKQEKKVKKTAKKTLEQKKQEFTKQGKQKVMKKKQEDDNFSKLVSKYKMELFGGRNKLNKDKKWFEN